MAGRGVHFALTGDDEQKLLACPADQRPDLIGNDIETVYFDRAREWLCETDKAWDAIHRAFGSSELDHEYRSPLHGVVLGGEPLYFGDDYIISLKSSERVRQIAAALAKVSREQFGALYFSIDPAKYGVPLTDEDFEYSWDGLRELTPFYDRAARAGRSVIFTTDQ